MSHGKKGKHQSARIGNYVYFTPAIARGAYSQVFVGYHIEQANSANPTYVAIKRITSAAKKKMSMARIQREINLLKLLKHPNIVNFHDAFPDIAENIYIVTEYCNYGDLDRFTRKEMLDHEEIKDYMTQLRNGLYYLLQNNILHRDLKPKNILLQKDSTSGQITVKIADFGFAKIFENLTEDSLMETLCGTPMYLSPEMVKTRKYSMNSDLWSVGVMIFQLFYHSLPFAKPRNILELIKTLENVRLNFPPEPIINRDAKELMISLLQVEPQHRCTWGNFFGSPWFPDLPPEESTPSITASISNLSKDESETDKDAEGDEDFFESCKESIVHQNNVLEDSGIRQARKLLEPAPPPIDELEIQEYSSRLFGAVQLKDDHFRMRIGPSSLPLESKFISPLANPMFISGISHSISPVIRSNHAKETPDSLVLDKSLNESNEELYKKSRTYYDKSKHETVISKRSSQIASSGRKSSSEWLSFNASSWTRSGEDIAKTFNDAMNSSAAWIGKNISAFSPLFGKSIK